MRKLLIFGDCLLLFLYFIRLFLCALFVSFERATSNYYSSVFFLCVHACV